VPRRAAGLVRLRLGRGRLPRRGERSERLALLQQMTRRWPFFAALISNLDMVIAKSDLGIAARYVDLVEDRKLGRRIFARIEAEWQRTNAALTLLTGEKDRLASNPPWRDRSSIASPTSTR
jgi:phosphoenolpyruvate carboxylase